MTLSDLIIVAGHAIYTADDFDHPERDENWCLQSFQKGEPPFYLEHIRHGIELVAANEKALLLFSGGMTRVEAGRRSEGGSYRLLAEHCGWLSPGIADRVHAEEYARDSFENLLFGLCGFHEITGAWPRQLTVVSWSFKQERFRLHADTIRWPRARFHYAGVNDPPDPAAAFAGEKAAIENFRRDPFGTESSLAQKRAQRNPFHQLPPYPFTCPALEPLLNHRSAAGLVFPGPLPWDSLSPCAD